MIACTWQSCEFNVCVVFARLYVVCLQLVFNIVSRGRVVRAFFDDSVKSIYEMIIEDSKALPEVGYELSNESFEVVAELELAWPDEKVGVYIEPPERNVDGWTLFSAEDVSLDLNLLFASIPNIKDGNS